MAHSQAQFPLNSAVVTVIISVIAKPSRQATGARSRLLHRQNREKMQDVLKGAFPYHHQPQKLTASVLSIETVMTTWHSVVGITMALLRQVVGKHTGSYRVCQQTVALRRLIHKGQRAIIFLKKCLHAGKQYLPPLLPHSRFPG